MATLKVELESGVLSRVADDEPIFVLRAKDAFAIQIVGEWVKRAYMAGVNDMKIAEANDLMNAMARWQATNGRKTPD